MFFLFILSFWYRWWHHSGRLGYTTSCFAGSLPASKRSIECIMRTHRFGYHPSLGQGNSRTGIELHFFLQKFYYFSYQIEPERNISLSLSNFIKKTQGLLNEVRFLNWKKIKFLFFVTTQVRRDAEKETLFFLLFGLLLLFFFCSLDRRGKEFNNLFNFHDSRWRKRVDFWLPMKRHWPVVLELKSQPAFRYYY